MNLADILKEYRIENRVSQGYMARKTNLDRTTISKLESGERRKPTKETLKKLSNGLKIDFDILVNAAGYEIEEKDYPFNYTIIIEGRYSTFGSDPDEAIKNARELIDETMYSIIGKSEQFDNVKQLLFSKNARVCNNGKYKKYSGYLKCADCGCSMYREKSPKVNYPYYYCGNYRNKKGCTKHYINELDLDRLILEVLNKEIDLFCNVEDDIEKVILNSRIEYQADLENIRKEKIAKEIKKYELLLKESLNDYKNGLLSEEDFDTFNDDYLFNLNKLRIEQEEICNNDKLDLEWFNKFKKYKKVESITRDILDSLIEKILIYEDGNIKIIFNFQNEYDELIRYLNSHDFVV